MPFTTLTSECSNFKKICRNIKYCILRHKYCNMCICLNFLMFLSKSDSVIVLIKKCICRSFKKIFVLKEKLQPVYDRNKCYWRVAGIGRPLINDFSSTPPSTTPTICFYRHGTSKQKMLEGKTN